MMAVGAPIFDVRTWLHSQAEGRSLYPHAYTCTAPPWHRQPHAGSNLLVAFSLVSSTGGLHRALHRACPSLSLGLPPLALVLSSPPCHRQPQDLHPLEGPKRTASGAALTLGITPAWQQPAAASITPGIAPPQPAAEASMPAGVARPKAQPAAEQGPAGSTGAWVPSLRMGHSLPCRPLPLPHWRSYP